MKSVLSFVLAASVLFSSSARAQTSIPPTYKDEQLATVLSVIFAGGGQLYTNHTGKGLTLLGITVGAVLVGTQPCSSDAGGDCQSHHMMALAAGAAAWAWGIITAGDDARQFNSEVVAPTRRTSHSNRDSLDLAAAIDKASTCRTVDPLARPSR